MEENVEILKSFDEIVKANQKGELDDPFLVKANLSFKQKTNWKPSESFEINKAKTFKDYLNGKEPNQELFKALVLGDTKVKNGVTYVVKKTPSGKLDWRVLTKKKKVTEDDDFPNSLNDLEEVKRLGGSTGAKLVKDKDTGELFVLKRGASQEHIEEEFLANEIYSELGINVPKVKLYNKGKKDVAMLSKYMENTEVANNILDDNLKKEVMNNYVADCLLANWDIYKNDNILINKDDGQVYRVDNGGSMRFSATGREKGEHFTDEVDELDSMIGQNMAITSGITQKNINSQIANVLAKEKAVLSLIKDTDLKLKMKMRFADLKMRLVEDEDVDPNREFTEKELSKILKKVGGYVTAQDSEVGWSFLSEICKKRGFDGLPTVVEDKEFDNLIADKGTRLLQRGLTGSGGQTAKKFMKDFVKNETCFYGTVGMYGAGIYAAVNETKKNPPPPNRDYDIAYDYANYKAEHIIDIALTSDAKVIDAYELDKMMNEEFFGEEFKEKKAEYDDALNKMSELKRKASDINGVIEEETKEEMNWNKKALKSLNSRLDITLADPDLHSFKKVGNYFGALVNQLGGTIQKHDDKNFEIKLPHSQKTFMFNATMAKGGLKKKSTYSTPYNLHYRNLRDFIVDNHFVKINEQVKENLKDNSKIDKINQDLKDIKVTVDSLADEVNTMRGTGSSALGDVMTEIAKRPNGEYRGFYAAIKGYDAIVQKNGWGGSTDFAVILNRSKMVVRKF